MTYIDDNLAIMREAHVGRTIANVTYRKIDEDGFYRFVFTDGSFLEMHEHLPVIPAKKV